ncbi:hypothetical protein K438DRAFT_773686 [Mycena galopus ATCC 62051]|nr:hypothetical protein K438DRAFT_773686 [Mycena galopus ATCC 62051]
MGATLPGQIFIKAAFLGGLLWNPGRRVFGTRFCISSKESPQMSLKGPQSPVASLGFIRTSWYGWPSFAPSVALCAWATMGYHPATVSVAFAAPRDRYRPPTTATAPKIIPGLSTLPSLLKTLMHNATCLQLPSPAPPCLPMPLRRRRSLPRLASPIPPARALHQAYCRAPTSLLRSPPCAAHLIVTRQCCADCEHAAPPPPRIAYPRAPSWAHS